MKILVASLRRYLPLVGGITALVLAAVFIPWSQVWPYLQQISPAVVAELVFLSCIFYFGRIFRYWVMLRMLGQPTSIKIVAVACLAAQPIAVLPGGELYRGVLLQRYGNVSLKDGSASVFAQSLAEALGLVGIAVIGTWTVHRYVVPTTIIAVVLVSIWVGINLYRGTKAHRVTNLIPGINLHHSSVRGYLNRNRLLLSGWNLVALLAASMITTGAGITMVLVTCTALGHPIGLGAAAIVYALPVMLEIVSFLPGGLGANEGASVVLLTLFGCTVPLAIAITIIVRLFTLVIGFGYGFLGMAWAKYGGFDRH